MTDRRDGAPRTVIRGAGSSGGVGPGDGDLLPALASPVVALARRVERDPRPNPLAIAAEAKALLAAFDRDAGRSDLSAAAITTARDALVAVLDARARTNPALPVRAWARALRDTVPRRKIFTPDALRTEAAAAERAGPAYRDLARFLRTCGEAVAAADAAAARLKRPGQRPWGLIAILVVVLTGAGWGGYAEYRYREALIARLPDFEQATLAGRRLPPAAAGAQLDALAATVAAIEADVPDAPLGLIGRIPALDPGKAARAGYARAVAAAVAAPLGNAVDLALATEGEPTALYDSLRLWRILSGSAPWQPSYVAGWIADRAAAHPELQALAGHLSALGAPPDGLPRPDPEAIAESRRIAAEGSPADRAFVELRRSGETAALPAWTPPADVAALGAVLARRSGAAVFTGLSGLYTVDGWSYARDRGVPAAIETARREAAALLGPGAGAPVEPAAVLALLQQRTVETWTGWLSDLRVRAMTDQPSAMLITGRLAARGAPLAALFQAVWREAGGEDRGRGHADQLRVATALGPSIQYVQQGHMADISQLFAGLNVTLAALDRRVPVADRQLLDIEGRARSILALQQAPPLVAGIIEDVLAQSATARVDLAAASAPLDLGTATPVAPDKPAAPAPAPPPTAPQPLATDPRNAAFAAACRATVTGRYPFADGADADLDAVAALFGPTGLVRRTYGADVAALVDTTRSPWVWKPEARLSGRTPEAAAFLQRAFAIGDALFPEASRPAPALTLVALAQRGAATVGLGGRTAPVSTTAEPVTLAWPGPDAAGGFTVAMDGGKGVRRLGEGGPWGLQRFLDGLRLRAREDGRRFLLDVRDGEARIYVQMEFGSPLNPVTARGLMKGLACPAGL